MSDRPSSSQLAAHRRSVISAVDQYEQRLVRFAMRLLGDQPAARDVVQHAFLQLCRQSTAKMTALEDDTSMARWLFSVVRHRAIDYLRSQQRQPSVNGEALDDVTSYEPDPATNVQQQELGQRLLQLVGRLPDAQRECVLLWAEGWSSTEVSEITHRTASTVRVHLHKAFKTLREQSSKVDRESLRD